MSAHDRPKAVGGKALNPLMVVLLLLAAAAVPVTLYRFIFGIGHVANMTDGFTWGIWEPVNVIVLTGIGAGAYGVGLLCYLLNKGKYHAFVRPAVLVGAICYTLGATSILFALGRYWNSYQLPWIPYWNLSSALLEVAICVLTYVSVLWVEVLPSVLDGAAGSASPRWSAFGKKWGALLAKAMPYLIALAMILPTMHQSSLGGLMLIAGPKVHPLWHTALLPLLYLISCLSMGYGSVVVLVNLLRISWNAKQDQKLFAEMSKVNAALLFLYAVLRVGDIAWSGKLQYLRPNFGGLLFLVEMALFLAPAVLFLLPRVQRNAGRLFGAALLSVAAGALYRVDTYMTMYRPAGWMADGTALPAGWDYWPSMGELGVSIGLIAFGIATFIFVSRKFPVVVVADRAHSKLGSGSKAVA